MTQYMTQKVLRHNRMIGVGSVEKRKIQSRVLMAERRKKLRDMGFEMMTLWVPSADVDKVRAFVASLEQPPAKMDHTNARDVADQP